MFRVKKVGAAGAALLVGALFLQVQADGQEFKGQVKIGLHKVKLEANKLYQIEIDSPKDFPLNVEVPNGRLVRVLGKDFRVDKIFFLPNTAKEYSFYVLPPGFGLPQESTVNYSLKITAKALAEKPLLQEKVTLTQKDATYKDLQDSFYKPYKVNLKAGQLYLIDLVKAGQNQDPFLFLEGPDGKVVAQDDDSGGDLNARIIYAPLQDGEFRIIATDLRKAVGDYTLTVRVTK
jgi:hypothetical protein